MESIERLDGGADPGRGGVGTEPEAESPGPSGVSEYGCGWAERHLGGGLQGAVPVQEQPLLLPADGERPGERYLLGVDAHPAISCELTQKHFQRLFKACGLPNRIRTDNGVPFASNTWARLSQLSAWFIKLGIYPELIEPGGRARMASMSGCTVR